MGRIRQARQEEGSSPRVGALSTQVYQQLREDVLAGRLRPGERLRVQALSKRFEIANSPIREALNRLLSDEIVVFEDQKGFRVAPVSESELRDILHTRTMLDSLALTEAIRRADVAWEEALVLALHRLSRATRHVAPASPTANTEWERLHRNFHTTLTSGCGSRLLSRISEQLLDYSERYRLLAADGIPERNELDEHRAIVDACVARDAARATKLLEQHYGQTFEIIMKSAGAPP